jgi:hypothetical protein
MLSLDLFNTKYERELREGAVDDLEARRIDILNDRMQDLLSRAKESQYKNNPAALAGLKREYQRFKDERDSYYKVREAGIPGNIPTEKIPGKEDLLKGRGRSYYEADQKKNSEQVDEYISMGSDKNYQEAEPYKNYRIYVRKKPFGTTGMYTAHTEIDRKEFMGKGSSQEEAVQAIQDRIDFVLNAQKKVTGSSTIDFNVKFATDLLADPRQTFYAKLENINGEPKLVIASAEVASDPELLAAGDFKRSALRNQPDDSGRATPLPGIPLTAKGLRSGDWIANGRYTVGRETSDQDGNRVFDLTYHSTAHTKSDKLRLNQPAFTLGTAREVDEHGGGIGPRQHWQDLMPEQSNPKDDDWYDDEDDQETELRSGDYVRDTMDGESGEVFRMQGDPYERRVRILDRDGKGWYIEPSRLTRVDPTDPDVQRYFGKHRQRDMDEVADEQINELDVNTLKSYADKRGAQVAAMKADNPNPTAGSKEWIQQAVPAQQVNLAKRKIARKERQQGMAEGWSDAMVARRTGGPRTPYSVYIKGKKWKDFENDDHAEAVANKLRAKFKAEGKDPSVITIAPTDMSEAISKFYADRIQKQAIKENTPQDSIQRYLGITSDNDVEAVKAAIQQIAKDNSLNTRSKARLLGQIGMMIKANRLPIGRSYYQYMQPYMEDQQSATCEDKGIAESAMSNLHADLADVYNRLAPGIERNRDSFKAGQLYDALEAVAEQHGAEAEFKRMMNGARNRAHMEYDTNPGGFHNWFWYLPFADEDVAEGLMKEPTNRKEYLDQRDKLFRMMAVDSNPANKQIIKQALQDLEARYGNLKNAVKEESSTESEAVERAILNRIMVAHTDLLMKFGPEKVMQAAEEVAYNVGDVDEIGTSDVSAYVHQVKQILGVPEEVNEKWSQKYKSSINCANPKGFSQKAHCAGRKK